MVWKIPFTTLSVTIFIMHVGILHNGSYDFGNHRDGSSNEYSQQK